MSDYKELIERVIASNASDHDDILRDFLDTHEIDKIRDRFASGLKCIGLDVTDVTIDESAITAILYTNWTGDAIPSDEGSYQDEDGDNFDYDEEEKSFCITITNTRIEYEQA